MAFKNPFSKKDDAAGGPSDSSNLSSSQPINGPQSPLASSPDPNLTSIPAPIQTDPTSQPMAASMPLSSSDPLQPAGSPSSPSISSEPPFDSSPISSPPASPAAPSSDGSISHDASSSSSSDPLPITPLNQPDNPVLGSSPLSPSEPTPPNPLDVTPAVPPSPEPGDDSSPTSHEIKPISGLSSPPSSGNEDNDMDKPSGGDTPVNTSGSSSNLV